jgi:hypothetical protein
MPKWLKGMVGPTLLVWSYAAAYAIVLIVAVEPGTYSAGTDLISSFGVGIGHKHLGFARREQTRSAAFLRLRNVGVLLLADRYAGVSVSDQRRSGFHHPTLFHRHLATCRVERGHSVYISEGPLAVSSVPNIAITQHLWVNGESEAWHRWKNR